jgi:DNA-binding transcriptional LysR family regulator
VAPSTVAAPQATLPAPEPATAHAPARGPCPRATLGSHAALHDLEAESALPLLHSGELDAVVAEEYEHAPRPRDAGVTRYELGEDGLLLALPSDHRLASKPAPVELADPADEVWATPWAGTAYTTMVERACRAARTLPMAG